MEEDERKAIRVWMRTVMSKYDLTANRWAEQANTSSTNITRFLNSDSKFIPSARTIAKLAAVVGSTPQLLKGNPDIESFTKRPVINHEGNLVDMIVVDDDTVELYQLGYWTGMGQMGIMSYSTVVVKPVKKIKDFEDGDIVLYHSKACGLLCGMIENNQLCYYPRNPTQYPETFTDIQSWRPIPINKIVGPFIGKVIQCMTKF